MILHPTRAEAGAARCTASAAVELGPHTMRRSRSVGPDDPERSNLQIARIGEGLVAVWPDGENSLRLQSLADDGTPRGAASKLAAEGAPALFSLVPHGREPLALLQLHRRCHNDNGARCIDSWWISASGAPAGGKLEEYLGHNNSLSRYAAITVSDGVLAAKTFDDTRQGYRYNGCESSIGDDIEHAGCPVVMPPPSLDHYSVGAAGAVVVSPLLAITEKAQAELFVPLAAEELRGALHRSEDREGRWHNVLRLVGRDPVTLADLGDLANLPQQGELPVHLDPRAATIEIVEPRHSDVPVRVHRYRLDGTRVAPPSPLEPGTPFGDLLVSRLGGGDREVHLLRGLLDDQQTIGEPLLLASGSRKLVRFATMNALLWDRSRYVALYAVPARKAWTVTLRTITCGP